MNNKKLLYGLIGAAVLLLVAVTGVYVYQQMSEDSSEDNSRSDTSGSNGSSATPEEDNDESVDSDDEAQTYQSEKDVSIVVESPARASQVSSPLEVTGEVPGSWSHEGQFTVRLLDSNSNIVAEGDAQLDGEWMTEDAVPFKATLEFDQQSDDMGILVLERANPSGEQENADSLTIPVTF